MQLLIPIIYYKWVSKVSQDFWWISNLYSLGIFFLLWQRYSSQKLNIRSNNSGKIYSINICKFSIVKTKMFSHTYRRFLFFVSVHCARATVHVYIVLYNINEKKLSLCRVVWCCTVRVKHIKSIHTATNVHIIFNFFFTSNHYK